MRGPWSRALSSEEIVRARALVAEAERIPLVTPGPDITDTRAETTHLGAGGGLFWRRVLSDDEIHLAYAYLDLNVCLDLAVASKR